MEGWCNRQDMKRKGSDNLRPIHCCYSSRSGARCVSIHKKLTTERRRLLEAQTIKYKTWMRSPRRDHRRGTGGRDQTELQVARCGRLSVAGVREIKREIFAFETQYCSANLTRRTGDSWRGWLSQVRGSDQVQSPSPGYSRVVVGSGGWQGRIRIAKQRGDCRPRVTRRDQLDEIVGKGNNGLNKKGKKEDSEVGKWEERAGQRGRGREEGWSGSKSRSSWKPVDYLLLQLPIKRGTAGIDGGRDTGERGGDVGGGQRKGEGI